MHQNITTMEEWLSSLNLNHSHQHFVFEKEVPGNGLWWMRRDLKGDKELLGTAAPGWQEFPREWYQQARGGEVKGCCLCSEPTLYQSKLGRKGVRIKWASDLEARVDAEATEGYCLLVCSTWPAFL